MHNRSEIYEVKKSVKGLESYSYKVKFQVLTAALMMEAASTSETSGQTSTRLHGATSQKTAIFFFVQVYLD
jgi:hypothetical protein